MNDIKAYYNLKRKILINLISGGISPTHGGRHQFVHEILYRYGWFEPSDLWGGVPHL